jgi:hypothetical protein
MSRFSSGGQGPRHGPERDRGRPQQGDRGRPQDQPERSISTLWPGYLQGGYFYQEGNLKLEYVSRDRVEPFVRAISGDHPRLTPHQVRRFFGHCRALETKLRSAGVTWASIHPELKRLDIAAADGRFKRDPKISPLFHDFIRRNVDAVKSQRDFLQGFLPHFEAFIGFGQAHFDKQRS